ncbi:MAG TPA: FCD domain-containing protein [Thermodesulfobacteriota bacterium]
MARRPLPEEVASVLAEEIRAGRLSAGAFLPAEPRLVERFGVSRSVVREATRILAARGLVEVRRGVGVVVRDAPDPNLGDALAARIRSDAGVLRDIWDVRMMLEPAVAAAAAERATAEEVDAIARAAEALETASDPVGADLAFHEAVMRASHNRVVALILAPLGDLLRAERAATLRMGLGAAARGHRRIAAAIAARDAAAARAAMAEHLVEARRGLERALAAPEREPVAATDASGTGRHPR